MNQRFKLPAAVFLLLIRNDQVLLMRRRNTGWHDGDYDLVAGHIDGKESLSATLCREAKEEIGIHINPKDLAFKHLLHGYFEDGKEYLQIFFTASRWQGTPTIDEPDKCDALEWFPFDALPANLTPATKDGLSAYLADNPYSEFGF